MRWISDRGSPIMTNARLLLSLFVLAAGFFAAAVVVTTGHVPGPSGALVFPVSIGLPALPQLTLPTPSGAPGMISGFIAGWCLRWLYGLPWRELPRAILASLASLRRRVTLAALAIGCVGILLFF